MTSSPAHHLMARWLQNRGSATLALGVVVAVVVTAGCRDTPPADRVRASGHVEATEVRVGPEVGGRILELRVDEGARVNAGDVIARLDTVDTELALTRARAERLVADAQVRLLLAGAREEDIRQAAAQEAVAQAELSAAKAELASAEVDFRRFDDLVKASSGSEKQRDDAKTGVEVGRERVRSGEERVRAARELWLRLKAGARKEEVEAGRARVAAADAQIAILDKAIRDAVVVSPVTGIVTEKLVEQGEIIGARTTVAVITDIDHAWANVYISEPLVARVRIGQAAQIFTDAGGRVLEGRITYVSPKAEFTPRNVQTVEGRRATVYAVKLDVPNPEGQLKPGMPADVTFAGNQGQAPSNPAQ